MSRPRAALPLVTTLALLAGCAGAPPRPTVETRVLPAGGAVVAIGWDRGRREDLVLVPDRGVTRVTVSALSHDPPAWQIAWRGGGGEHALVLHAVDDELALQRVPPGFVWTEDADLEALPGKRWAAFPPRQGNQGGVDLILQADGELETVRDWERVYRRVAVQ